MKIENATFYTFDETDGVVKGISFRIPFAFSKIRVFFSLLLWLTSFQLHTYFEFCKEKDSPAKNNVNLDDFDLNIAFGSVLRSVCCSVTIFWFVLGYSTTAL